MKGFTVTVASSDSALLQSPLAANFLASRWACLVKTSYHFTSEGPSFLEKVGTFCFIVIGDVRPTVLYSSGYATARASVEGICYHAVNRGNARGEVFHQAQGHRSSVTSWERQASGYE